MITAILQQSYNQVARHCTLQNLISIFYVRSKDDPCKINLDISYRPRLSLIKKTKHYISCTSGILLLFDLNNEEFLMNKVVVFILFSKFHFSFDD